MVVAASRNIDNRTGAIPKRPRETTKEPEHEDDQDHRQNDVTDFVGEAQSAKREEYQYDEN